MKFVNQLILSMLFLPIAASTMTGDVIIEIRHRGLEKTGESTVNYYLLHRVGGSFDPQKWEQERDALMDLDIFADITLDVYETAEGTELVYSYKELPLFLVFPAMKRTDQDGLLIGPGITFMNVLGMGIHQEFLNRYTILPEPFRAREFLSYTRIPRQNGFPFDAALTLSYFDSYNALKSFDEKSVYSELDILFFTGGAFSCRVSSSLYSVRHDEDNPFLYTDDRAVKMFMGEGDRDIVPTRGAGIIHDTRERKMNPHAGFYKELKVSTSGRMFGGDGDWREYLFDFRGYVPAGRSHIFHMNLLAQYRPGDIPGYELYHIGGTNSLRTYSPDPDICGQHEVLWTFEYRYELFANRQISIFDMDGYYGLQLVAGTDSALYWLPWDSAGEGRYLYSFFAGVHLLVPVLERVRLEFGFNGLTHDKSEVRFGVSFGWYEKASNQRNRVR